MPALSDLLRPEFWAEALDVTLLVVAALLLLASVMYAMLVLLAVALAIRHHYTRTGPRPVLDLARAARPTASGTAPPARRDAYSAQPTQQSGDGQRVMEHRLHPRGAAQTTTQPDSSLINLPPAAGARPLPSIARCDDSPGETGTVFSGELARRPGPVPAPLPLSKKLVEQAHCGHVGKSTTCPACPHGARSLECGEPAHPATQGCPHACHVVRQVVHTGETGALFVRPPAALVHP